MEEASRAKDTEQVTIVLPAVAIATPSTPLAMNNSDDQSVLGSGHPSHDSSITGDNMPKLAAEFYDSDTTLQSEQDNATLKLAGGGTEAKDFPPDHTLQQLLKAHSEQNTVTTARVEVVEDQNKPLALDAESNTMELLDMKSASVAGTSNTNAATDRAIATECGEGGEGGAEISAENETTPTASIRSIGSLVCRICHNSENPERLVSPCFCKGSLTYVHIHCLERWISTSRSTTCELCQFQYNTEQTLRYTCFQSLRIWYSRTMSRRALQEDCQMFSLLTLVAFGIIGTLLVGIKYYFVQGRSWGIHRVWTKGWLIFFLFATLTVYFINIYMIMRSQLAPWYRWWQSARDIKLILENRKPFQLRPNRRMANRSQFPEQLSSTAMLSTVPQQFQYHQPQAQPQTPQAPPVQPTTAICGMGMQLPVLPELLELSQLQQLPSMEAACKMPLTAAAAVATAMTAAAAIEIPLEGFAY